jgi:IMP dehydrogenase
MKILKNKAISFDDIILVPQHSDIKSRSEIDTSVRIQHENKKEIKFSIPIISSPMSTVTEAHMCNAIRSQGGLGIIHRYNSIEYQARLLSFVNDTEAKSAAIGVTGDYKERLAALVEKGLNIVCIDIAHGDHIMMEKAIEFIRSEYNDLFVIAGNVASASAYKRLAYAGAHGVRTSVGSGSICTTRIQTGHGMPTLQAVIDITEARKDLINTDDNVVTPFVIADGGIKNSGDIVKSLAAGADFVMLGSMLSGTKETPGKIILNSEGKKIKRYNGMASKLAQKNWKGSYSSIEGVSSYVPYKGTISKVINEIMSNVRSGMSYTGSRTLKSLRDDSIAIIQTSSSHAEGSPHIFNRNK